MADIKKFRENLKVFKVIKLLNNSNVTAVDLRSLRLKRDNQLLVAFVQECEDLEIVGQQVRKVDREKELERYITIKEQSIKKSYLEIQSYEEMILKDLDLLMKARQDLKMYKEAVRRKEDAKSKENSTREELETLDEASQDRRIDYISKDN
jgi:hypothetical protein